MTLKHTVITSLTAVLFSVIISVPSLQAADAQPKYTIKDVMKALHKGDENIGKKVSRGQGTSEDFSKLLDYYSALPANKPPRGEQASWDAKTAAMVKAAKALKAGDAGAVESYKAATNCKACHTAHRPEKKP
jgi:cytochrome c553